jgi:hypothetical protein
MSKLICWLFGHKTIAVGQENYNAFSKTHRMKCTRCNIFITKGAQFNMHLEETNPSPIGGSERKE